MQFRALKILKIPGYTFEYVPTPLASGGVALFVKDDFNYIVLEKVCHEVYQPLCIEITSDKQ